MRRRRVGCRASWPVAACDPALRIPGVTPDQRTAILAEAERICAYTNATAGHVGLDIVAA
ncbi:hypothetical protein [Falsiroseomonas tokyonensis]|uniref:Uncharacterized protein n=1 Tax=Falsiroseomonas tokyonensis TaxID=430521 RepID=A0ABV7C2C9_9PROT|nr:hypothetical protein [Falsiroseomonas tokyonensis]MBU8540600.1 hypothetical protein [Falsiroseomonas tokyonensis]